MELKGKEDTQKILLSAEKAAVRAKDLTGQLLKFSKGGVPDKKIITINNIIKESAIFALRGRKSTCIFQIPEDLWCVEVDEGQISQVINNLQ